MPVHPVSGPRPTASQAERAFYQSLASGLPSDWSAWHSLRVRADTTWEGEGDFVIAVPDRAIVIVEVKGGAIECRDGQWTQNGSPMKRSPRDQAHNYLRILKRKLEETFNGPLPPILIITAFPNTPFQTSPGHGDLTDAVLGQQDMPWLGAALEELVERQLAKSTPVRDTGWSSALHRLSGDSGQSFWAERAVPKKLFHAELELRTRYRSPEALATFADLYRPEHADSPAKKCTDLRVVSVVCDDAAVLARVKVEVAKAIKDGAKPGDIAVLSLVGQTKSRLCKLDRLGDVPVARADAPGASSKVVADTFLRFKGLERPYVIVTELAASAARYDVRMHVALTRATVGCVVVGSEEEIARDRRLQPR